MYHTIDDDRGSSFVSLQTQKRCKPHRRVQLNRVDVGGRQDGLLKPPGDLVNRGACLNLCGKQLLNGGELPSGCDPWQCRGQQNPNLPKLLVITRNALGLFVFNQVQRPP